MALPFGVIKKRINNTNQELKLDFKPLFVLVKNLRNRTHTARYLSA
jgi:hypothetical protein